MQKINWTKIYDLNHEKGFFNLYISEHDTGYYYGGVWYYTRSGKWEDNTLELSHKLEQFMGNDEQSVYDQCVKWINDNLPGKFNPTLRETKTF